MKLIGLDFETANPQNGSICAIGLALLQNSKVIEKREWLIRPDKTLDWMLPAFTEIHNIGYFDLRRSPEFSEVWPIMRNFIANGNYVIIHNASFDLRHLRAVMKLYHLPSFSFDYICSLELCRNLFPEMPSHSLDAMAKHFGMEFRHHDALEDAIVCASLVSRTGIRQNLIKRFEYDS